MRGRYGALNARARLFVAAWLMFAACGRDRTVRDASAPRPLAARNARAAATSSLPALLERTPLTGRGVLIGQWDEGAARASHVDLIKRVATRDGAPLSKHATHIAGTIVGSGVLDAAARGMASDAALWSYRWDWDVLEERAAAPFVSVSAHAYGVALGWAPAGEGCDGGPTFFGGADAEDRAFGAYGKSAAELDRMIHETGSISVWAAGNERMDAGPAEDTPHFHYPDCATEQRDRHADEASAVFGTLGGAIAAKNVIAVGATADVEGAAVAPELIVPLSFSSFGPTDDGRIKPDLAASGETLYSASAEADDAYGVFGGTSSSAAVVAGGIALLIEHYRAATDGRDPSAAEMKALLVHGAREAGAHEGPDYGLGYGLFDVAAAAELLSAAGDRLRSAALEDGATIQLTTAALDPGTPLRVTLAWLDPPASDDTGEGRALINDLDVALIAPDGAAVFYPWRLDRDQPAAPARRDAVNAVDTVEQVDVAASANVWSGAWTVRVRSDHALSRGAPQAFALAASIALTRPSAPVLGSTRRVLVELAADATTAEAELAIENLGGGDLHWSLGGGAAWLEPTEREGLAPSRPVLRIDASELGLGTPQLATLELRAGEAAPVAIGVVVQRACDGECSPAPQACRAVSLGAALGAEVAHGHSDVAAHAPAPSCAPSSGASATFTWRAPHDDVFVVALRGATEEAVLYALREPCGTELACAAASEGQQLELDLTADQEVALVVDSPADDSFALAIHSRSGVCFGQCGGTPDGACYCDASCVERGDCCAGACEACGRCDPERCEPSGCGEGERCSEGTCVRSACFGLDDGDACDDRDACTEADICIGGACAGTPVPCEPDPTMPDAATPETSDDAARPDRPGGDAGFDAGPDAGGPRVTTQPACSCRVASSRARAPLWLVSFLFLALAWARFARRLRSP